MPEESRAHGAFEQLRQEVQPFIQRPGVESAQRTVRRRRVRFVALNLVALVCAVVTSFVLIQHRPMTAPVVDSSETAIPTVAPTTDSTTGPVVLPSAPASVGTTQPGQQQPTSSGPSTPPQNFGCLDYPVGWKTTSDMGPDIPVGFGTESNGAPGYEMCAGVTLRLKWATYSVDANGTATVYRTGSVVLSNSNLTATVRVDMPVAPCPIWIIARTDVPFPPSPITREYRTNTTASGPFWDPRIGQNVAMRSNDFWTCSAATPTPTP